MLFSVNELVGMQGLPGTTQGLHLALKKRAGTALDLVRKREGSKAFEYHIDCLHADTQEAVRQRHFKSVLEQSGCKSDGLPIKRHSLVKTREKLEIMRQCSALHES